MILRELSEQNFIEKVGALLYNELLERIRGIIE